MSTYKAFLDRKRLIDPATGIDAPDDLPSFLFPHQRDIARWALRRGRAAVFAGTGLGKTVIELTWADHVARHTSKPVLRAWPRARYPNSTRCGHDLISLRARDRAGDEARAGSPTGTGVGHPVED